MKNLTRKTLIPIMKRFWNDLGGSLLIRYLVLRPLGVGPTGNNSLWLAKRYLGTNRALAIRLRWFAGGQK